MCKSKQYKILSIDPGLSNIGYSCAIFDTGTNKLEVQKTGILHATKAVKKKEGIDIYGSRLLSLNEIESTFKRIIKSFEPDYVVSEDAFYCSRFPNAYSALLLSIYIIERTLYYMYEKDHTVKETARVLYKLAPRNIKKLASGNSLSYKSNMSEALVNNPDISFVLKEDQTYESLISSLTEHEVDAISGGFAFAKSTLPELTINEIISNEVLSTEEIAIQEELSKSLKKSKKRKKKEK